MRFFCIFGMVFQVESVYLKILDWILGKERDWRCKILDKNCRGLLVWKR